MKILNLLFNIQSLQKSRLPWIDFAKGIAIMFVVYRHILIGLNRSGFNFAEIYFSIAEIGVTFRMHLFFIISGIFIRRSIEKRTGSKFITDKLKTLIYPYLIWTVIQVTLQIVMGKYTNSQRSAIDYLYIITQPRAIDQFWFIYALFNISIVYYLLFKLTHGNKWVLLGIGLLMYTIAPWVEISVVDDVLDFFLFLVIGDLVSSFILKTDNLKYFNFYTLLLLALLFSTGLWLYFSYEFNYFELAVLALLGSALTINLAFLASTTSFGKFLRIFGYHSLYIFLMHSMTAAMVRIILVKLLAVSLPPMLLLVCCLLGCVLPVIAYNLMVRGGLWFFFTPDNPQKHPHLSSV